MPLRQVLVISLGQRVSPPPLPGRYKLIRPDTSPRGQKTVIERIGETSSQALAYCDAGAFIERMYQNTGSQDQDEDCNE